MSVYMVEYQKLIIKGAVSLCSVYTNNEGRNQYVRSFQVA